MTQFSLRRLFLAVAVIALALALGGVLLTVEVFGLTIPAWGFIAMSLAIAFMPALSLIRCGRQD